MQVPSRVIYKLTVEYDRNDVVLAHFEDRITREQLEQFIKSRHSSVEKSPVDFRLFLDNIMELVESNEYSIIPLYIREFYEMPMRTNPVFVFTAERYDQLMEYYQMDTSEVLTYKITRIPIFDSLENFNKQYLK